MQNKVAPRHIGHGLIEIGHHRYRDVKLQEELEAEKRYGFNWRKKLRRAQEEQAKRVAAFVAEQAKAAAAGISQDAAESVAPVDPSNPETEV